jgi:uncharacterized membrane protein YcaP (DUF421 family)
VTLIAVVAPVTVGDVAVYAAKSVIILLVLVAGFRLLGKREMAQINVYDLALLMAASNAVQNAMTGGRGNLGIGMASSSALLLVGWLVTRAVARHPALEARIVGSPTVLVSDGQVLVHRLRREHVTREELDAAIRGRGLAGPREVRLAVLEVDGSISVVPAESSADDRGT